MAQETLTKKAVRAPVFGAVLLAVAFAFTLILGCGGGDSDESTGVAEATPDQVVGYAQTDDESVILYPDRPDAQDDDIELADGGSANQGTWLVQATFSTVTDTINDSVTAAAGKRFVVFNVSVTNNRQSESISPDREFKLHDPSGTVVDLYEGGMEPVLSGSPSLYNPKLIYLLPTEVVDGLVTFEVSDISGWHYVTFKSRKIGPGRLVWGIEIP